MSIIEPATVPISNQAWVNKPRIEAKRTATLEGRSSQAVPLPERE
jgi:hypothetical protein